MYKNQYIENYRFFFRLVLQEDPSQKSTTQECQNVNSSINENASFIAVRYCDGNLNVSQLEFLKYRELGIPKKLALKWHIKKSDYSAYFWFEDEEICAIFNKFYGQHPDTKTDFIIHIDPIKKKYELSLYRYGLKEPVIIPESAYQLIVFKSGFENYRSKNYNQERGAWIW